VPLFDGWRFDPAPLYVVFPPNRHVSAKLRVFVEWVAQLLSVHAPVRTRATG
jgi:DNA-binding transcriptional LysR family regulator